MTPGQVKALRARLDLTQSKFAALLGVNRVTVAKWETGAQTVSPMAERLLRLLGAGRKGKR